MRTGCGLRAKYFIAKYKAYDSAKYPSETEQVCAGLTSSCNVTGPRAIPGLERLLYPQGEVQVMGK